MLKLTDIIYVENIKWDINDNIAIVPEMDDILLPDSLDVHCDVLSELYNISETDLKDFNNAEIEDYVSEYLSDTFGFCICSFSFKVK